MIITVMTVAACKDDSITLTLRCSKQCCCMSSACLSTEVGFGLRKDDPSTLRQLLIDIHSKSSNVDVTAFSDPYVLYLLT